MGRVGAVWSTRGEAEELPGVGGEDEGVTGGDVDDVAGWEEWGALC